VFDGSLEAMKVLTRTLLIVLAAPSAHAGSILDYIRNYDLNDYALGLSYSISESPYRGGDSNGIVYPYLTSFRHNAFTDDWLILTGGDVGVRWVNESGWVLGAVTRIRTEGTDSTLLDELADIDIRKWRGGTTKYSAASAGPRRSSGCRCRGNIPGDGSCRR
jgi:hypothetical protein